MILIQVETGQKVMTYLKETNIPSNTKSNNRLSVQLSLSGLSFLVTDATTNEVVFFSEKEYKNSHSPEELLINLTSSFSDQLELQENFSDVTILYATTLYALVPTPLFDEKMASEYLKLNSKILANDFIAYDTLENNDITIVYIPYININNFLFERFGNFKYYHSTTLLLKYILNIEKHTIESKIYINIEKENFDIIIVKKGELLLCNTYEYKTPEDFIYYILFCLEQLKLNPDSITCVLSGIIDESDAYYNILFTYIRHISFINSEGLLKINDGSRHHNLLLKLAQ